MSYFKTYEINFNTPVTEQVRIELHKKEVNPGQVTQLKGTTAQKQTLSGNGDGADTILVTELRFGLWLTENDPVNWPEFIVSFHDEWLVKLFCDNQIEFIGFITPNEGDTSLLSTRRDVALSATDNLGLLKKAPLKAINGNNFNASHHLIEYVAGALQQTGMQLNIRVYSNIYESSMQDRNQNPNSDNFNQSRLDYRSFLKDPLAFVDSNAALLMILSEGYSLQQFNGEWVIQRLGEMQGSAGPKIWYTLYDYATNILDSKLEPNDPAVVDKQQTLHPKSGDLRISCNYSVKSAKHTYNYTPWPEIPLNNKFEFGAVYDQGPVPGSNPPLTYKKSVIDNWLYGVTNPSSSSTQPPNGMLPTTDPAYRYSTYDVFGTEQSREVVMERTGGPAGHRFLRSSSIPVDQSSRIEISFDFKISTSGNGQMRYLLVMLEPYDLTTSYRLTHVGGIVPNDGYGTLTWERTFAMRFMSKNYQTGEDFSQYNSFSFTTPPFPKSGKLYIVFVDFDPPVGRTAYYRNFSVEYHPYIAGGYVQAKGDVWATTQNKAYLDEIDETVAISDSEIQSLQGALYRDNGTDLTTRSWHRLNINENRGYKELVNMARYNMAYRRFWNISGTFGGIGYYPHNNQGIRLPLGFHKHFVFPGIPEVANSYFQLVPPLTIDYAEGEVKGVFKESYTPGQNDGDQLGDVHEFKYLF